MLGRNRNVGSLGTVRLYSEVGNMSFSDDRSSAGSRARWIVLLAGVLLPGVASRAAFTPILPPQPGEQSQAQILGHIYGGTFTGSGSVNFSNGVVRATRIQDTLDPTVDRSLAEPTPLFVESSGDGLRVDPPLLATDQLWTADSVFAVARARFATYSNEFGYLDGTSGKSFVKLFWTSGGGYTVGGTASLDGLAGHIFRWGRDGDGGVLTSQNADNSDGLDHMITYRIDPIDLQGQPNNITTYVLFFEDSVKPGTRTYDADFNDMVVEIQASRSPIPEPAGLGAAALGLGLLRRRSRER